VASPAWLPDQFFITGDWDRDIQNLYDIFEADFKRRRCDFNGTRVIFDNRVLEGAFEEGFWHLVTQKDQRSCERLFDGRRAECLPWCRAIIVNSSDPAVTAWEWREGNGKIRTYLWLEEADYVVILQRRGRAYFLITAYHVDGDSTRRRLKAKYEGREA